MATAVPTGEVPVFSAEEVALHKNDGDVWIIVHGEIYDVTNYARDHPGGEEIMLEIGGQDGSDEFDAAGHSEDAWDITRKLHVGTLKKDAAQKMQRRKPQTARLAKTTTPTTPEKKKSGGLSATTILLSIGSSVACLGGVALMSGKQAELASILTSIIPAPIINTASKWFGGLGGFGGIATLSALHQRKGAGFVEGFLLSTTAFLAALGLAINKLGTILQYHSTYTPHKTVRRLPKGNVLNGRGWLDSQTFQKLPLTKKEIIAPDVYRFIFTLPDKNMMVGLPIGQHVSIRGLVDGKMVQRSYTPVSNNSDRGILELVIRSYADGALTNGYLSKLEVGNFVEFRGPKGAMRYEPNMAKKIGMVAGGTGITPMYQVIRAICENPRDTTEVSLIYANRAEQDILLRAELDAFAQKYPSNFKIHYVLEKTPAGWVGGTGYVTKEMMEQHCAVTPEHKVFVCGPPPMVASIKKSLGTLGFKLPGAISKPADSVFVF